MKKTALLLILALTLSLFISCKSDPYGAHEHKYEKVVYSLSEENKVLKTTICFCGAKKVEVVENAIVATPETALSELDSHNSGIIYFSAGEYKEELGIRHSKEASTAIKNSDNKEVDINKLDKSSRGVYRYCRTVENLTLIADENAVFKKDFKVKVGHVYGDESKNLTAYDPVRKITITDTNNSFYSYIDIDGIKFYNMKFTDGARLYFHYSSLDCHAKNIEIEKCSFTGLDSLTSSNDNQAIKFNADIPADLGRMFENLKISNCVIKTYNQGIYTQSLNSVSVSGCNISDVKHNAIAIQNSELPFTGSVLIDNNTIKNGTDRAIRFGKGDNATIVVSNNTIENAHDGDNQVLKAQTLTKCKHEFVNNTYIGGTLKEVTDPNWIVSFE